MSQDLQQSIDLTPDLAQLHDDLEYARAAEGSHFVWSMVSMSPLGLVVLFSVFSEVGPSPMWGGLLALAAAFQFWRWKKAEREVERLERLLSGEAEPQRGGNVDLT